jgi:hypothetical protein
VLPFGSDASPCTETILREPEDSPGNICVFRTHYDCPGPGSTAMACAIPDPPIRYTRSHTPLNPRRPTAGVHLLAEIFPVRHTTERRDPSCNPKTALGSHAPRDAPEPDSH